MRPCIGWDGFLGGMTIVTVAALILRAVSGMPIWVCFLGALVGALLNGWLATWEDEQPGGFNNPDPPKSN